jgi:hypothetical protein
MGYCTVRSARLHLRAASRVRLQEGGGRRRHALRKLLPFLSREMVIEIDDQFAARRGVRRVHDTCVNLVTSRDLIKV